MKEKKSFLSFWFELEKEGEKKKEKEKIQTSLFDDLRSSVGSRTKVHLLDEGYAWVPKTRDLAKDSSEEVGKSKVSGLRSVHGTS